MIEVHLYGLLGLPNYFCRNTVVVDAIIKPKYEEFITSQTVMKFGIAEFSIVVLANANNPSILTSDFLWNNNIVKRDLGVIEPICTPPFSRIKFEDYITITADAERLNFSDGKTERLPFDSEIPDIAIRYINVLKHVPYTSVGLNFSCYYDFSHTSPNQFLLDKFIKEDIWREYDKRPIAGLKLSFRMPDVVHNIEFTSGDITHKETDKAFPCVAVKSNFHYEPPEDNKLEPILEYIKDWKTSYASLEKTLAKYFK